jgi:hypothetical protein
MQWMRIKSSLVMVMLLISIIGLSACNNSTGSSASSGTASGNGYTIELTATQEDMSKSTSNGDDINYSTQPIFVAVRYNGVDAADGTSVTITKSGPGWFANSEGNLVESVTINTVNGRATASYYAPTSASSVTLMAATNGAIARLLIRVY